MGQDSTTLDRGYLLGFIASSFVIKEPKMKESMVWWLLV
jgi:hypothetical protein